MAYGFDDAVADAGDGALDTLAARGAHDQGAPRHDGGEEGVALIEGVLDRGQLLFANVVDEPGDVFFLWVGCDLD